MWTHRQENRERVADHMTIDAQTWKLVVNVGVCNEVYIGSNRRAVFARLRMQPQRKCNHNHLCEAQNHRCAPRRLKMATRTP